MKKYLIASAIIAALLIGLGTGYSFSPSINQLANLQQPETTPNGSGNSDTLNANATDYPTAWPSEKPDPMVLHLGKFNITSGLAYRFSVPDWNNPIAADGYTKFSVLYDIWDMSPGNYKLNVSIATITWMITHGPYAQEPVQIAQTSITRHAQGFDRTTPTIELTEIKAPHFSLEFQTQTDSANWPNIWIAIDVYVYLRN